MAMGERLPHHQLPNLCDYDGASAKFLTDYVSVYVGWGDGDKIVHILREMKLSGKISRMARRAGWSASTPL